MNNYKKPTKLRGYVIISFGDIEKFTETVRDYLNDGWDLHGDMQWIQGTFTQVVTFTEGTT